MACCAFGAGSSRLSRSWRTAPRQADRAGRGRSPWTEESIVGSAREQRTVWAMKCSLFTHWRYDTHTAAPLEMINRNVAAFRSLSG